VLTSASTVALLIRVSRERKPIIGIILAKTAQRDTLCSQHREGNSNVEDCRGLTSGL
jgi:hypothetical protein